MDHNNDSTIGATSQSQTQNSQSSSEIHHNHPLYIHPSDTQGLILISVQLQGSENYSLWSKTLKIVLLGKNKQGFVLGTCRKEHFDSTLHELWDRCNAIVLAWIMNTMLKDLVSTVIYGTDAHSTVSRSSAESEFRSMATTVAEIIWLTGLFKELRAGIEKPVTPFCDSKAAIQIVAHPIFHERTKHFDIDCHFVREKIQDKLITTQHIGTRE
ncbi:hypothetical protein P3L10_017362 [Capsicum annuum]